MAEGILILDAGSFPGAVAADKPILVDFWAEWCGPCRVVAPVLEEIAREHGDRLTIGKLNIDEHPATAQAYDVLSIPTLIVFQQGKERKRVVGARGKAALLAELSEFVA